MLMNSIILAIGRCDTLRPLGIYFRLFTNSVVPFDVDANCLLCFEANVLRPYQRGEPKCYNYCRT
jgi:hypothetical protein